MKRRIQNKLLGAVLALSLGAYTAPAWAQHQANSGAGMTSLGKVQRASKLIGKEVVSEDNQRIGKLENLVVDLQSGRILYGVVNASHGKVAVAPGIFRQATGKTLPTTATQQKLEGAPQFTSQMDQPNELGKAAFISNVYEYFGQPQWWQGQTAASGGQFTSALKVSSLDGMKVVNESNQSIGKVQDSAMQLPQGRIVYEILNPASSMKLGDNYYAVPPNALTWTSSQNQLTSNLSQPQLAAAPHFATDDWGALSSPSFASKVYQYYGKEAWFQTGSLRPTGR